MTTNHRKAARATLTAATLAVLAGCSHMFDVTNPGPVQEQFLNNPSAAAAIVNGAGLDLSDALNWIAYTGASVTREVFPAGSTGSYGITVLQQLGQLTDQESDAYWNRAQRARWEAESGIKRFKDPAVMAPATYAKSRSVAQILLWAGYANRLLGENMCDAVIDGGPRQDRKTYLQRAEAHFTESMSIATAAGDTRLVQAAQAGRASVRLDLGNAQGAADDAKAIPDAFTYQMPYFITDADQYNRIYWATGNSPYRAHTVWNTVNEQYYLDTKDPRVAWIDGKNTGDAAVLQLGRVKWFPEQKYSKRDAAINLSSGWEMRLIEAEARLTAGDVVGALTLLNRHRVALGLAPWTAITATDAWTALKRERGIELWLEGRRLGDVRRWDEAKAPGSYSELEVPSARSYLDAKRSLCFPIPLSELQTNPNLKTGG